VLVEKGLNKWLFFLVKSCYLSLISKKLFSDLAIKITRVNPTIVSAADIPIIISTLSIPLVKLLNAKYKIKFVSINKYETSRTMSRSSGLG
jgi:hypothetical protein